MKQETLLIELGTEELPPTHLDTLAQGWLDAFCKLLEKRNIPFGSARAYAAPRRLAFSIEGIPSEQPDRVVQKRGPALQAAFDSQGNPTQAALGFAKSNQVSFEQLEKLETDKGSWLIYHAHEKGQKIADIIPQVLKESLSCFNSHKQMRWYEHSFLRPTHWLLALLGKNVIPMNLFGLDADNQSQGHRFHHPEQILISDADHYQETLYKSFVIADYTERQAAIRDKSNRLARTLHATVKMDDTLLDLVTGINEWPTPMIASFDKKFLNVPQEALITAMEHHQKCFALLDDKGALLPKFILISNTDAKPNDLIIQGNERVMAARLSDAQFFYEQDLQTPLLDRLEGQKSVVFQQKLGTLFDKTERVKKLSCHIAQSLKLSTTQAERAALLSRCDLLSSMVGEFPELQGIMGTYYARHDKEDTDVANAIQELYLPRFASDKLPASEIGCVISLADRLDTLIGIFSIGLEPTGDKDPFALRRAGMGVMRLIIEKSLDLDLKSLLQESAKGYGEKQSAFVLPVLTFCFERAKSLFLEKGVSTKVIDAVSSGTQPTRPLDFYKRLLAVSHFQNLPEAESLAAANKRVRNILTKSDLTLDLHKHQTIDKKKLVEPEEIALYNDVTNLEKITSPLISSGAYTETLNELARLKTPVDAFFDKVMVNAEDPSLRQNRLALLCNLHHLFAQVADISKL